MPMRESPCQFRESCRLRLAYTLTEFMAVMTILAILAAVIGPRVLESDGMTVEKAVPFDQVEAIEAAHSEPHDPTSQRMGQATEVSADYSEFPVAQAGGPDVVAAGIDSAAEASP